MKVWEDISMWFHAQKMKKIVKKFLQKPFYTLVYSSASFERAKPYKNSARKNVGKVYSILCDFGAYTSFYAYTRI